MNITQNSKLGQIVAHNYSAAKVFQVSNIDYCCKGDRTLAEVCEKENLDFRQILQDLQLALQESDRSDKGLPYKDMPLDQLIDHIESRHHAYVEKQIPIIGAHLVKVCKVHGERHPELFEIQGLFNEAAMALMQHMQKEEKILFPFVRNLLAFENGKEELRKPLFDSVQSPIQQMEAEHDNEGERFRHIAALSDQYTPPRGACTTYRVTYKLLEEFEKDLHLHIHLENNILFPKAIAKEDRMVVDQ